jgi:hypothetical protein
MREVEHTIEALGEWQGIDAATGFQLVKRPDGRVLRIADLVDDAAEKRDRVSAALKDPAQKYNRKRLAMAVVDGREDRNQSDVHHFRSGGHHFVRANSEARQP